MNFLQFLLIKLIEVYTWIIIIRAIASWFISNPYNPIYMFLISVTEPLLGRIRAFLFRIFPTSRIDFSPLIAIFLLSILRDFIIRIFI